MIKGSSTVLKQETASISLISDGLLKLDGGGVFGLIPKSLWEAHIVADRRNRVTLGLNSLLIQTREATILVDTGVGTKESAKMKDIYGLSSSKLLRDLKEHNLSPKDIDAVILTHLHFDHCGGSTKINRNGKPTPTFGNAKYFVQRTAWEEATNPNERSRASYHPDDFLPLMQKGQLHLLDGDQEIVPGVSVKVTNGHTMGHQIVLVNSGGERVAFMGDLVPTPFHLELPYIAAYDRFPDETLEQKRSLLQQAEQEGWLMVFSHGCDHISGYLERYNGRRFLRHVQLRPPLQG